MARWRSHHAGAGQAALSIEDSWRLNEHHYGMLQGLNKAETAARYGETQFRRWRRGYRDTPPSLDATDPRHQLRDARYAGVGVKLLPGTESLADAARRAVAYWEQLIAPRLARVENVLVVAHGNT